MNAPEAVDELLVVLGALEDVNVTVREALSRVVHAELELRHVIELLEKGGAVTD